MRSRNGGGVTARIYANLGKLLGGKAAAGVLSLGYLAIAARALGPGDYGMLVLVHAYVMTVGGILEFPGWHAVVRYGAQALAVGDEPRLTRLLAFAGLVEGAAGLAAIAVAIAFAPVLGPKLGWSREALAFAPPYCLAILATLRATPAGYLQLRARFDLLGAHSAVAPAVRLAGATVAAALHGGLRAFLVAWLAAALLEWAAMWALGAWVAWGRHGPADLRGGLDGVVRENPGLWRFMLAANADVTLAELAGRIAPLAVGWMLGPAAAGFYAVAQRATSILAQPAQLIGQAAYAELARLVAAGCPGRAVRQALLKTIGVAILAAAPVCLGIAVFGRQAITLIAGPAFAGAASLTLWLALARTIQLAAPPLTAALTALGRPGLSVSANMVSGLGLFLLLPPLLDGLGLAGAGVHAVIQAVVGVSLLATVAWMETDRLNSWLPQPSA